MWTTLGANSRAEAEAYADEMVQRETGLNCAGARGEVTWNGLAGAWQFTLHLGCTSHEHVRIPARGYRFQQCDMGAGGDPANQCDAWALFEEPGSDTFGLCADHAHAYREMVKRGGEDV